MHQAVRRRLQQKLSKACTGQPAPTNKGVIVISNEPSLSDLTGNNDASPTTVTMSSKPTNPKPKRKQIKPTASAVQQQPIVDRKAKRHKLEVHKAAVRLYDAEKQKLDGLLIRQVQVAIKAKYEVCPSKAVISHYAKQGLINASPMKMGPVGHSLAAEYKFLCQACSSLVPINQMNVCTSDNSRKMMIPILAKTFNISTGKAKGLFNHVVRDKTTKINAEKLNCAEDRCICWTTYQNCDLWFDSWEVFVVEYGFATISQTGEIMFAENMMKRTLNLDETCLSLNKSNGNHGRCLTVMFYNICFPQLKKATSKLALRMTMISTSTAAGEPLPPHFQFQTSAQTAEAKAIWIETIFYMLDVQSTFGHETKQLFPISIGLNNKGGMDNKEFFDYLKKLIMKIFPDATPEKGQWGVIKCDSGPGQLNHNLLEFL